MDRNYDDRAILTDQSSLTVPVKLLVV